MTARVNWGNQITKDLVGLWSFHRIVGNAIFEPVYKETQSFTGAAVRGSGRSGLAADNFDGNDFHLEVVTGAAAQSRYLFQTNNWSWFFLARWPSSASAIGNLFGAQTSSKCYVTNSTNRMACSLNDGGGATTYEVTSPTVPTDQDVALGYVLTSGNQIRFFMDGVMISAQSAEAAQDVSTSFEIGASNTFEEWPGLLYYAARWHRTLSDAEMKSLAANPWQIFAGGTRLIHADVPGPDVNALIDLPRGVPER